MGGQGSGRKSVKATAINLIMDVQIMLNNLLNSDIDSREVTRDELKERVKEVWQRVKVVQEDLERL